MDDIEALREVGYTVLPALYSEEFMERARVEVVRLYEKAGRPDPVHRGKHDVPQVHGILSPAGLMMKQLLTQAPDLVEEFFHPKILRIFEEVLEDGVRLDATGACFSDTHRVQIHGWHHHIGGVDDHLGRPIDMDTLDPTKIRRLTMLVYLDEISEESGPLVVHPRKLSDPLDCPSPDEHEVIRENHITVTCPPGTAVLLEERTWHSAFPPKESGLRRFLGAMVAAQTAPQTGNRDPYPDGLEERALHRAPSRA